MQRILYKNNNDNLSKAVWQLYESAFPSAERRLLEQHLKAMQDTRFFPYIYTSEQSELIAICFYWDFTVFKYLEHFAVNPKLRNKGIGSKIIQSLEADTEPIILEIEPPVDKLTIQRLKFYERNNFRQTDYKFVQLKYRKNTSDLVLDLLCNKEMNQKLYEQFKEIIYKELRKYNEN